MMINAGFSVQHQVHRAYNRRFPGSHPWCFLLHQAGWQPFGTTSCHMRVCSCSQQPANGQHSTLGTMLLEGGRNIHLCKGKPALVGSIRRWRFPLPATSVGNSRHPKSTTQLSSAITPDGLERAGLSYRDD
eukprot:356565-Chlamydomonas_euryale.AAC.12